MTELGADPPSQGADPPFQGADPSSQGADPLSRGAIRGPVAVVGLGLMGGSLARALAALDGPPEVLGIDPTPLAGRLAADAGVIRRFDLEGAALLPEARTVIYAVPMGVLGGLLADHAGLLHGEALVMDVASLKAPVLRWAEAAGLADRYVGAHPMVGGEERGFAAAREDLYRNAPLWLTSATDAPPEVKERAEAFWKVVGATPRWTEPEDHDRSMAWVSHLPQLVSNALAGALDAAGVEPGDLGPGGRDMTRLAGSSPEMWKGLLTHSAAVTGTGLTSVSRALNVLADLLARREVDRIVEFMERTRSWSRGGDGS